MNYTDEMGIEIPQWVTLPICDRQVSVESSGEYSLPDYQPEIRRLLSVTPTVLPPAKYVGATQIELNGTVDYQVLYVGADGGLCSLSLSSEYNLGVPFEASSDVDLGVGVSVFVTSVTEAVTTRVSAPRRLNLRCRIRSHVCAYGKMALEERCHGTASPTSIRRRLADSVTMRAVGGASEPILLHEEIMGVGESSRVIAASAVPFVQDVRISGDGASASGELLLKLTVGHEDGRIEGINRKIPFVGEIDFEDDVDSVTPVAMGTVGELSVNVEDGRILCDAELLLEARARQNLPVRYTLDLYSTEQESRCEQAEYKIPVVRKCENANLSQSERLSASENHLPEGAQILDAWGAASFESCENAGGKYVLIGQSRYTLLCQKDGELSAFEIVLPLRYETEGADGDAIGFDARADVLWCRARIEGDVLCLDSELGVFAEFLGEERIVPIREVEFGEALAPRACAMTVYYPAPQESAWDVAKRYGISLEQLVQKQGKAAYYIF